MREIKFRAWDKELKFIVDSSRYLLGMDGNAFFDNNDSSLYDQTEKLVLMQYTGLKDKNGVEIYEWDILQGSNGRIVVCTYQAPIFVLKEKLTNKRWFNFIRHPDENQFETVIGNIYENPELLEASGRG